MFAKKLNEKELMKLRNVTFEEKVIKTSRVTNVVTGGRTFSYSAFVAIGSKNGHFGLGFGKAKDSTDAKKKAINDAKKNIYFIPLNDEKTTINHQVIGKHGSTTVKIMPSSKGKGIISGVSSRTIFECIGIKDILCKCVCGSKNPINIGYATLHALMKLKSKDYLDSIDK